MDSTPTADTLGKASPRDPSRSLTLKLASEGDTGGEISFSALAAKLAAVQAALFNLGLAQTRAPVGSRGNWSRRIRSACELFFVAAHTGSAEVIGELPDSGVLPGMPDFGQDVLRGFHRVVRAALEGDETTLVDLMPDSTARLRTLKSLQELCPRPGEGLEVSLGNGVGPPYVVLTAESRQSIGAYCRPAAEEGDAEPQTITGELVEIRVQAGARHVVVLSQQREIECLYPTVMEETISQLVAGSAVEVTGRAQVNMDGSVKQVDEIYDIFTIDLAPFTTRVFRWGHHRFVLRESVVCIPAYQGGLWIYECPRYRLHAFSRDRADALSQFNEEFAFLYQGLINESDESLTLDAVQLRDQLRADVIAVEEM